ncbi:MAG TPA: hypothetical protein PKC78_16485 [Accumulibacter sp.]|uniref:hypothetical protein n=1 Tax=Accumulibacter sp. TaxID=2053492 RepID=UPI002B8C45A2|nr:hypothetical protein [Accumulibacter sp.]HMW81955.1 hypothetical protein [Accumulibacter sp.]HND40569.1 hypothetical protein [Accumulibacter sp.]HNJ51919.1 hypothetical protein [Accumulibacter sp.]
MEVIRQFYEDAPTSIAVPESLRHKRLEVILLVPDAAEIDPAGDLKSLLAAMPDVGEDADFTRPTDYGRGDAAWDS